MRTILACGLLIAFTFTSAYAQRAEPRSDLRGGMSSVVPADWTLQPPDPNWAGKRLTSPDGNAWLAVHEAAADRNVAAAMQAVAVADGEKVTYLRRGQSWIVVSGFKNDRIFYRKAMLACGSTRWHHIAFEYPARGKRTYDRFVTRASHALAAHRNDGCTPKMPRQPA